MVLSETPYITLYNALSYLLDNINIRFGNKLYRRSVGIPMGTNCAPLVSDLFLFCYKENSILLFLMTIKPILLRQMILRRDIKTIFLILTIHISKEW